ncbi:MAG: hypothetical protein R2911_34170 [Caldilineaceae bacterium]
MGVRCNPFADLAVGDIALFHAGQTVAVDGTIVQVMPPLISEF